jgi:hypothetical protein
MEQHDFVNLYIGRLVREVDELVKSKMLLEARGEFKDAEINELRKKLTELEEVSAKERDEVALTWKTALEEESQTSTEQLSKVKRELEAKNTNLASKLNDMHREIKDKEAVIVSLQNEISELKSPKVVEEPKAEAARRKKNSKKETNVLLE